MNYKTYNGWTNYETWCVNLWLDNDQNSSEFWRERAIYWSENESTDSIDGFSDACLKLSDELKEHFETTKNDLFDDSKQSCSVWSDLLGSALGAVEWREIAAALIESLK